MAMQRVASLTLCTAAACLGLLIILSAFLTSDPYRCEHLVNTGAWSSRVRSSEELEAAIWTPRGCMMQSYTSKEIQQCAGCSRMVYIGDSAMRQLFWATAQKLNATQAREEKTSAPKHENLLFELGCMKLEFLWDPYLNLTASHTLIDGHVGNSSRTDNTAAEFILIGTGLWHARYLNETYLLRFDESISRLLPQSKPSSQGPATMRDSTKLLQTRPGSPIVAIPIVPPNQQSLGPDRAAYLSPQRVEMLNNRLRAPDLQNRILIPWSFLLLMAGHQEAYEADGIHVVEKIATTQADIILNLKCNDKVTTQYPFNKTCCAIAPPINAVQALLLVVALILVLRRLSYLVFRFQKHFRGQIVQATDNSSRYQKALALFAAAVLHCFVADRTLYFGKVSKNSNQQAFLVITGLTLLAALITSKRTHAVPILKEGGLIAQQGPTWLSREQTEEWKGWMQIVVLLYHYFAMSQVLWIYQVIRLLVASYLFMTGFGHTVYLLKTHDFSLRRVSSVLTRLNLLSCVLAYVMRTDYDFYYFPALSSFWFTVVTLTIGLFHPRGANMRTREVFVRSIVSVVLVGGLVRRSGILECVFGVLHTVCKMNINVHEFRFRVSLDMYVTYAGILLGSLYSKVTNVAEEGQGGPFQRLTQLSPHVRGLVNVVAFGVLVGYALFCGCFDNKFEYNKWHPFVSWLPICAFVTLRNASPWLKAYHVPAFAWLGRCSLETFVLQYHIWLAADTKGLLHLPFLDGLASDQYVRLLVAAITTPYFLWASWGTSRATAILCSWSIGPIPADPSYSNTDGSEDKSTRRTPRWTFWNTSSVGLGGRLLVFTMVLMLLNWLWRE